MTDVPHDKEKAYIFFLSLLRAGIVHIAFCLVAVVSFAFGHFLSASIGFIIIAVGTFAVAIDLARRSGFGFSLGLLVAAVAITAMNIA